MIRFANIGFVGHVDHGKRTLAAAVMLAMALGGCAAREIRPEPVAAGCNAYCYTPCTTSDIRWTADPSSAGAWDALGDEVVQPLSQRTLECSRTHRRACHLCLWRLQEAGVLVGVPPLSKEEPP